VEPAFSGGDLTKSRGMGKLPKTGLQKSKRKGVAKKKLDICLVEGPRESGGKSLVLQPKRGPFGQLQAARILRAGPGGEKKRFPVLSVG